MTAFISLADVKTQLSITGSTNDAELALYLDAACDIVESWVGPVSVTTFTENFYIRDAVTGRWIDPLSGGAPAVALKNRPIVSVTAITSAVSGYAWLTTGLIIRAEAGIIYRADGSPVLPTAGSITYTAGRSPVPSWAALAARIITQHLWRTRQSTRGASGESSQTLPGTGYAVPNQAAALLDPHRVIAIG